MTTLDPAAIDFIVDLTLELLKSAPCRETEKIDKLRFPSAEQPRFSVKEKLAELAASRGLYRIATIPKETLYEVLGTVDLDRAYALLADEQSKRLFVKLLVYRILGPRHVLLPRNNEEFWKLRQSLRKYVEGADSLKGVPIFGSLDLLNFNGIRFQAHKLNIESTFLMEQYRYRSAEIGVESGDVVIDGGGCWGDTSLYFAQQAGQVFCFECMPSNLKILEENLQMNPSLATKIRVIPKALWDRSGEKLGFEDRGPASLPASGKSAVEVETQTIDDFVSRNSLKKVDFIKMDIEGAEPRALTGAERTIREHRPKLAIAIYHDLCHFASIPTWINALNLGYRFYVDHFTIHQEETILFARTGAVELQPPSV